MAKILFMEDGRIRVVEPSRFTVEAVLQDYLEQFPDLLPLYEVEDNPPPLLTIGREVPVPSGAIDLLFIDANGLLTIVETKLAKNPQVRREVIGQIIEYASFVSQWDADDVEQQASDYLASKATGWTNLYEALAAMSDTTPPPETVRSQLEENLRRGRIRLVVAVDELVEPLRATVSFLNSFSAFDLLILQLRDFEIDSGRRVFIPSVFGYSPPSKVESQRRSWDEKSFFADAESKRSPSEYQVIRALYDLAVSTGRAQFGTGRTGGSFSYKVSRDGRRWFSLITVFTNYGIQFSFGGLLENKVPREVLAEFRKRANSIPGVSIPEDEDTLGRWPSIQFRPLTDSASLDRFKESLLWLGEQVVTAEPGSQDESAI